MPSIDSWAPPRFGRCRLESYDAMTATTRKALIEAQMFASGGHETLVLSGPTGSGKTHLAVAAARGRYDDELRRWEKLYPVPEHETWNDRQLRERLHPIVPGWCSIPELIVGLRADMDRERGERTWSSRLDGLAAYPGTVVLDDLGQEKVSDWTGEAVYVLVNGRYERMAPTIVTTNLTGAELAASPYWPVISRLAEDGELVRLEAADYRLRKERAS